MKLAIASHIIDGEVMLWKALTSSPGVCGNSCSASSARSRNCTMRASISIVGSPSGSSMRSTRAARNGSPGRNARTRNRCTP